MQNCWFSNGRASARNPPPLTAGEGLLPPPLVPPDPPDPLAPLSASHFPPLSSPLTQTKRASLQTAPSQAAVDLSSGQSSPTTTDAEMAQSAPDSSTTKKIHSYKNWIYNYCSQKPSFSSKEYYEKCY